MDVCVVAVFSVKRVWFATRLCLHVWCGKSCVEFIQFMSAFVDSSRSWDQSYNVYPIVFKFTISTLWIACSWTWSANDNSDGGNVKVGYWMTWVMSALVIGQCSHLFVGSNAFWKGSVFSAFWQLPLCCLYSRTMKPWLLCSRWGIALLCGCGEVMWKI